jgi:hypothetical protein
MDPLQDDDAGSSTVLITVLWVTPIRAGKLFALASVEINIGGVLVEIHGIRATRTATGATRVELPTFRDATGQSRAAIVLPEEVYGPIGDAVLEVLIERGIAKRRFTTLPLEAAPLRQRGRDRLQMPELGEFGQRQRPLAAKIARAR